MVPILDVGDLHGRGSHCDEAVKWLKARFTAVVMGNHERPLLYWLDLWRRPSSMHRPRWRTAIARMPLAVTIETAYGLVGLVRADVGNSGAAENRCSGRSPPAWAGRRRDVRICDPNVRSSGRTQNKRSHLMDNVRVAIAGIGNCASSLIQGIEYYRTRNASCCFARDGRLFVYTRLPEHNARSIWGRYFPGFAQRETRLLTLGELHGAIKGTPGLRFTAATCFPLPGLSEDRSNPIGFASISANAVLIELARSNADGSRMVVVRCGLGPKAKSLMAYTCAETIPAMSHPHARSCVATLGWYRTALPMTASYVGP